MGDVDLADLMAWQRYYSGGLEPIAASQGSVPEPTTAVLGLLILMGVVAKPVRCKR